MRSRDWIGRSAALACVIIVTSSPAIAKLRKHRSQYLRPYEVVWPAEAYCVGARAEVLCAVEIGFRGRLLPPPNDAYRGGLSGPWRGPRVGCVRDLITIEGTARSQQGPRLTQAKQLGNVSQACKMIGYNHRQLLPLQGAIRQRWRTGVAGDADFVSNHEPALLERSTGIHVPAAVEVVVDLGGGPDHASVKEHVERRGLRSFSERTPDL